MAVEDRRRGDRHAGERIERQGDLRQVLGAAQIRPGSDDLQPVRGVRQLPLALRRDRACHGRGAAKRAGPAGTPTAAWRSPPARPGPSPAAITSSRSIPTSKIIASEALQCPTLLQNGFGAHRIEGIGDKHVPWIHNVKNTDLVVAIDDNAVVNIARLFNEPEGKAYLKRKGVPGRDHQPAGSAGFLGHRQRAFGDQVRQVLRADRERCGADRADRLDGAVRHAPGRIQRGVRRLHRLRRRRGLRRRAAGS